LLVATLTIALPAAKLSPSTWEDIMAIEQSPFGTTADGTPVSLFTLASPNGLKARITNYGGIVVSLEVPDARGDSADVVLGYDDLDAYIADSPYFGCIVGRYGNRIANARFSLDGQEHVLAANDDTNNLHGGETGFDKVVWDAVPAESADGPALQLRYLSKDGEEGFPGNLDVTVVYTLTADNGLRMDSTAVTDKPTIVNITHHSYFNLAGAGSGDILGHEVMIDSDSITPVNENLIPTGELMPVDGTPFDFRSPAVVGARIEEDNQQLERGGGYDHNWVLRKPAGETGLAARVTEPVSGRTMEVLTSEPGMQFYTGNFLDGSLTGKGGAVYEFRHGFCMEPQHYPDSPNRPEFPSVVLRPGETYRSTITYRFG